MDYELDFDFAVYHSPKASHIRDELSILVPLHKDPKIIIETPDGPLAISHIMEQGGVIRIFTLEGN